VPDEKISADVFTGLTGKRLHISIGPSGRLMRRCTEPQADAVMVQKVPALTDFAAGLPSACARGDKAHMDNGMPVTAPLG
jgi:hypothetical protein